MLVWWVWRSAGRGQPSSLARRTAVSAGLWTRAQEENMEPDMRMTRWKCACRIMGLCTRYSTLAAPTPCTTVKCLTGARCLFKQIWQNSRNGKWYAKKRHDVAFAHQHQQYDLHGDGDRLGAARKYPAATRSLSSFICVGAAYLPTPHLAHQRDPPLVPAELLHVLADPLQGGHLVHQPVVGDRALRHGRGVGVEETCSTPISVPALRPTVQTLFTVLLMVFSGHI